MTVAGKLYKNDIKIKTILLKKRVEFPTCVRNFENA